MFVFKKGDAFTSLPYFWQDAKFGAPARYL